MTIRIDELTVHLPVEGHMLVWLQRRVTYEINLSYHQHNNFHIWKHTSRILIQWPKYGGDLLRLKRFPPSAWIRKIRKYFEFYFFFGFHYLITRTVFVQVVSTPIHLYIIYIEVCMICLWQRISSGETLFRSWLLVEPRRRRPHYQLRRQPGQLIVGYGVEICHISLLNWMGWFSLMWLPVWLEGEALLTGQRWLLSTTRRLSVESDSRMSYFLFAEDKL